MCSLLSIENLSAWYQKEVPVISDFVLELCPLQVVGLIGLNGAGKTTFINVLSGVHRNFAVYFVKWKGDIVDIASNRFKKNRYTVFSEDESFGYFTFNEYVGHVFASYGKQIDKELLEQLIDGFHFYDNSKKLIKDLSTGNKRKVYLMTGLALRPELLLLDEPVNGLDFQSTEFLYEQMLQYKKFGTVLFSSHILESITLTSDRVMVLEGGRITRTFEKDQIDAKEIREVLRDEDDPA